MFVEFGWGANGALVGYLEWLSIELVSALSDLANMKKRVSVWYLVTGILFAFIVFYWRYRINAFKRLSALFSMSLWFGRSARADYALWLLNRLLLSVVYPRLLGKLALITWLMYQLSEVGVKQASFQVPDWQVMIVFSICYFLLDDFSRFYLHRLMHRVPFLWQFHRVHHSATRLMPFTVLRTHPVEGIMFYFRSLVVQSALVSLFLVLFPGQVSLFMVVGVFSMTFAFNVLGANLRHSPVALSYGPKVEKWLISPAQHQLHHSVDKSHYDCNFGVVLAIWDSVFSSWVQGSDAQVVKYGTGTEIDHCSIIRLYFDPFVSALKAGMAAFYVFRRFKSKERADKME
ncbi:sterol desaturase family protein [Marinomonas mediterranea]|uniref:Fatty acid hydroxylase n=1 Tax=Marinomonas mediterranea (strain ATCC 700492 / JCM 21426 / NBRC 103028 / MMB-1) TaxID=717774 RepID=F2K1Z0_MARM1|nr:sterol desaturase family protein [Marinomonas mediterranea]ADZ89984.1 fatty acid hydroxylase [Marinomonas mediterranea MMB-1]WCN08051.1 sterol desaturase family protein [Marinomonas mediterranea]WCN16193.1 sterol desaturase family protein [Marinomonas mediterranea MMB-1]